MSKHTTGTTDYQDFEGSMFVSDQPDGDLSHKPEACLPPHTHKPLPTKHSTWTATTFAMAKCDCCELQRRSIIQSCNTCSFSICRDCYDGGKLDGNALHDIDESVDWAASKKQKTNTRRTYTISTSIGSTSQRRGGGGISRGRGRGRGRARGAGRRAARGLLIGVQSSRARGGSYDECSSSETTSSSPSTVTTMESQTNEQHDPVMLEHEDGMAICRINSRYSDMQPSTEDENTAHVDEHGEAARILASIPQSGDSIAKAPQSLMPAVLRFNGVPYGFMDNAGNVTPLPHPGLALYRSRRRSTPRASSNAPSLATTTTRPQNHEHLGYGAWQANHGSLPLPRPQHAANPMTTNHAPALLQGAYHGDARTLGDEIARGYLNGESSPPANRHSSDQPVFAPSPASYRFHPHSPALPGTTPARVVRTESSSTPIHSRNNATLPTYDAASIQLGQRQQLERQEHVLPTQKHDAAKLPSIRNLLNSLEEPESPRHGGSVEAHHVVEQPPLYQILIGQLSESIQLAAREAQRINPRRSLDECLREEAMRAWNTGEMHQLAARLENGSNDRIKATAAFTIARRVVYRACVSLCIGERSVVRDWLRELEQSLDEEDEDAAEYVSLREPDSLSR